MPQRLERYIRATLDDPDLPQPRRAALERLRFLLLSEEPAAGRQHLDHQRGLEKP